MRVSLLAIVAMASGLGAWAPGRTQPEIDFERDVLPAVVQISARIVEREGGRAEEQFVPRGSGSIITPSGLILTSAHVLDVSDVKALAETREEQYAAEGRTRTVRVSEGQFVLEISERDEPPAPRYTAQPIDGAVDELLDLAVLRITGGSRNQPVELPELTYLTLGNSNLVQRRDEIEVIGYPGIAETAIVDDGTVNGFETEAGVDGWAWIITDATVSGGSSGGAAVDSAGRLIGVTTLASELECRPGDINGDGEINEADVGCVPVGGALARLRPINLAKPLLEGLPEIAALTSAPGATATSPAALPSPTVPLATIAVPTAPPPTVSPTATWTPSPPAPTPTPTPAPSPTSTPTPTPTPTPAAETERFPTYGAGNMVVTTAAANMRVRPSRDSTIVELLPVDTSVRIIGNAVEVPESPLRWWQVMNPASDRSGFVREDLLDWPPSAVTMRRGNAARTGETAGPGPIGEPAIDWRVSFPGWPGVAAVVGDTVYARASNTVAALDAATGAERWRASVRAVESPAVVGGTVYADGAEGVFALDAATGRERWQAPVEGLIGVPAVSGATVYVGSSLGVAYAFDAATGEELWQTPLQGWLEDPAVAGGTVYINSRAGYVYALDAATGDPRWRSPFTAAVGPPAVSGGMVYVGDVDGDVTAIAADTGEPVWGEPIVASGLPSAPAVSGGTVYVTGDAGVLYALDAATGDERWRAWVGGASGTLTVAAGTVYVGGFDGQLSAFDATSGALQWRLALDGGATFPVVSNGAVFIGVQSGAIYAIRGVD